MEKQLKKLNELGGNVEVWLKKKGDEMEAQLKKLNELSDKIEAEEMELDELEKKLKEKIDAGKGKRKVGGVTETRATVFEKVEAVNVKNK